MITAEQFDVTKMKQLFGKNWVGVTAFNLDTNQWTGPNVTEDAYYCEGIALRLKSSLEHDVRFKDYDLVATVSMRIQHNLPDHKDLVENPEYVKNGNAYVCTIVTRKKTDGKIQPVAKKWPMVSKTTRPRTMEFDPLELFLRDMMDDRSSLNGAVISLNCNQRYR